MLYLVPCDQFSTNCSCKNMQKIRSLCERCLCASYFSLLFFNDLVAKNGVVACATIGAILNLIRENLNLLMLNLLFTD